MTLFILSFLAGALTILAPCILPVIPFVFARADRPFLTSGLPLLAGMAISFAAVATLASLGGAWAAEANEIGRGIAIAVLAAMGLALLVPAWAERWTQPLVALGARLGAAAERDRAMTGRSVLPSFGLGVATGLLWAPCAGPVLGLVLTTAALQGASAHTSLLLLAYVAGASTSLAAALWAGSRVFAAMKRSLGATKDLGVVFPVALDNDFAIWKSLSNQFWPALYFVDAQGRIRHHHFGEGDYDRSEQVIRQLLEEARGAARPA